MHHWCLVFHATQSILQNFLYSDVHSWVLRLVYIFYKLDISTILNTLIDFNILSKLCCNILHYLHVACTHVMVGWFQYAITNISFIHSTKTAKKKLIDFPICLQTFYSLFPISIFFLYMIHSEVTLFGFFVGFVFVIFDQKENCSVKCYTKKKTISPCKCTKNNITKKYTFCLSHYCKRTKQIECSYSVGIHSTRSLDKLRYKSYTMQLG